MVEIVLLEFSKKKTEKKERKKNETKPQIFKIQKREFSQKKKLTKKIQINFRTLEKVQCSVKEKSYVCCEVKAKQRQKATNKIFFLPK